jgi:long-chain acyl-CoA synthetase
MTRLWRRDERRRRTNQGQRQLATLGMSGVAHGDALIECSGWTVPGMLAARAELTPDDSALCDLAPSGEGWVGTTWEAYRQAVAVLSAGFRKLGVAAGDRVGIMAPSCREWDFAQLGILAAGGVAVGLDPYALDDQLRAVARQCNFVGLVLAHPSQLDKLDDALRERLAFVVCLDAAGVAGVASLAELLVTGDAGNDWNHAQPEAPATIIFTSGTTGEPKGIEYSHRQLCLAAAAILSVYADVAQGSRLVCWLPLSNLFQRMINLSAIGRGAQTYYVADPRTVMAYVKSIEPALFIGVPRFFEKLHASIQEVIAQQPAWQQKLVRWALQVGDRRAAAARAGRRQGVGSRLQFLVADWLALGKLRGVFGRQLRFMVSGSAPMPIWLLESFHAMGFLVLEAYGVSENILPVSLNAPEAFRFGSVGRAVPGCDVRLAEDGELLVGGPGVFSGYLGEEGATVSLSGQLDGDGYLASGDFASVDADGFITLIGRKSDIFKTSTGRRIAPASIESHLQQLPEVEQAVVFGTGRPQPVALLVLGVNAWQVGRQDSFRQLRAGLCEVNERLAEYQRPAGLLITARELTSADGDLTANLKLRRKVVEAKLSAQLLALFTLLDTARGAAFEAWSDDAQTFFYCSP